MSEKDGQNVECPKCGTTQFRTTVTEAMCRCRKCNAPLYAYVSAGGSFVMDMDQAKANGISEKTIQIYVSKLFEHLRGDSNNKKEYSR